MDLKQRFEEFLKQRSETVKSGTHYKDKALVKLIENEEYDDITHFKQKSVEKIMSLESIFSRKNHMSSLNQLFKFLNIYTDDDRTRMIQINQNSKSSTGEKEIEVPEFEDLQQLWKQEYVKVMECQSDNYTLYSNVLLIDLMLNYPPLRLDVYNLQWKDLDIKKGVLNWRVCNKTYKQPEPLQLNETTMDIINQIENKFNILPDDYLIEVLNHNRFEPGLLSRHLQGVSELLLNQKLSCNMFRKIRVRYIAQQIINLPPKEQYKMFEELAQKMMSNVNVLYDTYNQSCTPLQKKLLLPEVVEVVEKVAEVEVEEKVAVEDADKYKDVDIIMKKYNFNPFEALDFLTKFHKYQQLINS